MSLFRAIGICKYGQYSFVKHVNEDNQYFYGILILNDVGEALDYPTMVVVVSAYINK